MRMRMRGGVVLESHPSLCNHIDTKGVCQKIQTVGVVEEQPARQCVCKFRHPGSPAWRMGKSLLQVCLSTSLLLHSLRGSKDSSWGAQRKEAARGSKVSMRLSWGD